jgi:nucleotide-binding universal stress UspA family protein
MIIIMKYNFSRILVPVDGSAQSLTAFRAALVFARKYEAHLTTVHVDEEENVNEKLRNQLHEMADGWDYHYIHKKGTVHKEIINFSQQTDAELIVMGTHGVRGFQEFWMGSNAYKVVNSATCPVLTMREDASVNDFKTIVMPIDTSFESRQKVPHAIQVAKHFGSTLHVLGVSSDDDKDAEYKIKAYMRQVLHSLDEEKIPYVQEMCLGGNITDKTILYADEQKADLIIIMTEQELQIGSFFLGKFAQQMVNHSHIPVLSIPPRDDLLVQDARL